MQRDMNKEDWELNLSLFCLNKAFLAQPLQSISVDILNWQMPFLLTFFIQKEQICCAFTHHMLMVCWHNPNYFGEIFPR